MEKEIIILLCILGAIFLGFVGFAIYKPIKKKNDKKNKQIVLENSKIYACLLEVNRKYKFNFSLSSKISFSEQCQSKRALDSYNLLDNLLNKIIAKKNYYLDYIQKVQENHDLWHKYSIEYYSLNNYATQDDIANLKISLKTFNKIEKELFAQNKLNMPITSFTVNYVVTYTTPAGRNTYKKETSFTQKEFENLVEAAIELEEARKIEQQRLEQERIERERQQALRRQEKEQERERQRAEKAKQRSLTAQIEKKSKELQKREETLSQKEEEFKLATQGHIYSSEHIVENVDPTAENTTESTWVKLKRLKQRFDNGEITYEQYEQSRKDLLH